MDKQRAIKSFGYGRDTGAARYMAQVFPEAGTAAHQPKVYCATAKPDAETSRQTQPLAVNLCN